MTAAPAGASTVLDPSLRVRARRSRAVVGALLLLLVTAGVLAWAATGQTRGYLDPEAPEPSGGRALARLLADQGVQVTSVRNAEEAAAAAGPGSTLLVTEPLLLNQAMLDRLAQARPDVLVLVAPDAIALDALAPGSAPLAAVPVESRAPGCPDPTALRAGSATTGGTTYAGPSGGTGCYLADGAGTVLLVPGAGERGAAVLLGTGTTLTNEALADDGNAALSLGLLGSQPRLVWYRPSLVDPLRSADELGIPLADLVPAWVPLCAAWLVLAGLVTAAWRGRRLGPVVSEPLPVVVRSAEATEGRARLYRRSHARDRAAAALRGAALAALASALGVPRGSDPDAVVLAAATRTGRPVADVAALLRGPAPNTDDALVRLDAALRSLVTEVTSR